MDEFLTPGRREMLTKSMEGAVREPIKGAVKEALAEAEAERATDSGGRGVPSTLVLVGVGAAIGYLIRGRGMGLLGPFGSTGGREESPAAAPTTRPEPPTEEADEGDTADDAAGRGLVTKVLVVGAIVGLGYLLRTRTDSVNRLATGVKQKTGMVAEETEAYTEEVAEETEAMSEEVADRITAGGESVAERIEEGGEEMAGEVEETGEKMAEEIEETGERMEEMEDEMEERADEMRESDTDEDEESEEDE